MQCYKTVHQHYSIIDLPLSGECSQWGRLVFLCLGDMASGRNVHCNLMLHPFSSPSFPPRPSLSLLLFFHPHIAAHRWVLHSHHVSPDDSDLTRRSQQTLVWHLSFNFMLKCCNLIHFRCIRVAHLYTTWTTFVSIFQTWLNVCILYIYIYIHTSDSPVLIIMNQNDLCSADTCIDRYFRIAHTLIMHHSSITKQLDELCIRCVYSFPLSSNSCKAVIRHEYIIIYVQAQYHLPIQVQLKCYMISLNITLEAFSNSIISHGFMVDFCEYKKL